MVDPDIRHQPYDRQKRATKSPAETGESRKI
jgi:hypothetical protein